MKNFLLLAAAVPLVAHAGLVGVVAGEGGARLELFSEAGHCVDAALSATWINADGKMIPGCWISQDGRVQVAFFDGGGVRFPATLVKSADRL